MIGNGRVSSVVSKAMLVGTVLAVNACGSGSSGLGPTPAQSAAIERAEDLLRDAPAGLAVVATGGIAGLQVSQSVDSASGVFVSVTRRICAATGCQAPMDSATGVLPVAVVDGIFRVAEEEGLFQLRADYGTCAQCADQFAYVTIARANGRRVRIFADDGTAPEPLRAVHAALNSAIQGARGGG